MGSVATTADTRQWPIVWRCDVCGEPVADGAGYLTMHYGELHERDRAVKAWEERIASKYPGPRRAYPMSELVDYPERVRWHVLHSACDPRPDSGDDYWIGIERIRSASDVIRWSSHLLEKRWIQETSWNDLLRDVAGQLGGAP
jgi:hypothetical protein